MLNNFGFFKKKNANTARLSYNNRIVCRTTLILRDRLGDPSYMLLGLLLLIVYLERNLKINIVDLVPIQSRMKCQERHSWPNSKTGCIHFILRLTSKFQGLSIDSC